MIPRNSLIWFSRCLLLFSIPFRLFAQTQVGGPVEGFWTSAGNPYLVVNTLTILPNTTLTIQPGVEIYFSNPDSIKVFGTLAVLGEPGDSVLFRDLDTPNWRGIWFLNGSIDGLVEYASISAPEWGVRADHSLPVVRYSTINAQTIGVGAYYSDMEVSHCAISVTATEADAIYLLHSDASIYECRIFATAEPAAENQIGIRIVQSDPQILSNTIMADADGMACGIWAQESSKATMRYNLIRVHGANIAFGGFFILSNPLFVNNTIAVASDFSNPSRNLYLLQNSDPTVENCILYGDGASVGIYAEAGCDPEIYYTDLFNHYQNTVGCTVGVGSFIQDPLFVNAVGGDFHLQADSRCIDAGNPMSPPDPDGTRADMGCYYFDQSVYADPTAPTPSSHALFGAFPNPFNAQVELIINLPASQIAQITIYDQFGRSVQRLLPNRFQAGEHRITWNARDLGSGIYWAKLETGQETAIIKLCLVK